MDGHLALVTLLLQSTAITRVLRPPLVTQLEEGGAAEAVGDRPRQQGLLVSCVERRRAMIWGLEEPRLVAGRAMVDRSDDMVLLLSHS